MEKNLTAVMQIIERAKKYPSKEIRDYILSHIIKEEESIEMEKDQIIDAYNYGYLDYQILAHDNAEEYYELNFGH
jgi:hypothetical protein